MSTNARWMLGLIASIAVAVAGQADAFPHPYDHVFSLGGIVGTAITGYMMQPARSVWTEEKREAVRTLKQTDDPDSATE